MKQNRRDFIKALAATGAGSFLCSRMAGAIPNRSSNLSGMLPNNFTVAAVLQDVATLSIRNQAVALQLLSALYSDYNRVMAGNMSRFGWLVNAPETDVMRIMKTEEQRSQQLFNSMSKQQRDNPDSVSMQEKFAADSKVALMLGWFMADGIRTTLKPMWDTADDDYADMALYQDMHVLSHIASTGQASVGNTVSLLKEMTPRMITRTHTLTPDYDDGPDWTVRVTDWRKDTDQFIEACAAAFVNPDSDKLIKYVDNVQFYDQDDDIIIAARDAARIDYQNATPRSLYGQAVLQGIKAVQQASYALYPPAAVENDNAGAPGQFKLHGNFPNPFNPVTNIRFELPQSARVQVTVLNTRGRVVYETAPQQMQAGLQDVKIDASQSASGTLYFKVAGDINGETILKHGSMTLLK